MAPLVFKMSLRPLDADQAFPLGAEAPSDVDMQLLNF